MNRTVVRILLLLLCTFPCVSSRAQEITIGKKQVAVYVTESDVDDEIKRVVQQKFITALTQSNRYRVLERNSEFLKAIQRDRDYSTSGEVKDSQIVAIGKQYGAKIVLVVDLSELYSELVIQARMVDVESGTITASAEESSDVSSVRQLMSLVEKVAGKLIGQGNVSSTYTTRQSGGAGGQVETFTVNGVTFEMVKVDGGAISPFYIGKTEVTQRLWYAVMGSNPSKFIGDNNPVERVSWYDCQEFVERLSRLTGRNFRLPTEREWEYAAKGGNKSRGYEYSGSNDLYRVAWYEENSNGMTHPVGQKLDNELGIYDMSGNVWEWCSDCSDSSCSYRVFRGGGWFSYASSCRVARRSYNAPGDRGVDLGLRLAL